MSLRFVRTYATRWPRPKPGTSERPPYRAPDPLVHPSVTQVPLPDLDLTFIHRPPPTAPTPHSLTTNPSSPLLRPHNATATSALPPLAHPRASEQKKTKTLDQPTIEKLRALRLADPARWTRGRLASMFGVSQNFVGSVAPLKTSVRKQRLAVREEEHARERRSWSNRHSLVVDMRARRRVHW